MAVREADGDSRSYFREGVDPAKASPQPAFADMADWVLEETIAKAAEWQKGTPEGFDPWNSWGGAFTAKACAEQNAKSAKAELEKRRNTTPCDPDQSKAQQPDG